MSRLSRVAIELEWPKRKSISPRMSAAPPALVQATAQALHRWYFQYALHVTGAGENTTKSLPRVRMRLIVRLVSGSGRCMRKRLDPPGSAEPRRERRAKSWPTEYATQLRVRMRCIMRPSGASGWDERSQPFLCLVRPSGALGSSSRNAWSAPAVGAKAWRHLLSLQAGSMHGPLCPILCLPLNPTEYDGVLRQRRQALYSAALVVLGRNSQRRV